MSSMPFSGLRAQLHRPGPIFFAQTMFPEQGIASLLGTCGFDFIMIDAEHGPFTLSTLRSCIEAVKCAGGASVVRTASHSEIEIKQVLDLGCAGVMIPRVESAEEAAAVVRAARYAPEGIRGVSRAVRAARFGRDESYVANANAQTAVLAIIESGRGVESIGAITKVPGLDGIMIGGDDLSADVGLFGQYEHPRFCEAMEEVMAAARGAGLKVGARAPHTAEERDNALIGCGNDAIALRVAFEQALANQREALRKL
jgi:2-keto-3-deoxy-L-rhamnonate aldolase RhmA